MRVVKLDVSRYRQFCLGQAAVSAQIDLLVFERSPEALDEDVVSPAAFSVHAQLDRVVVSDQFHEVAVGELGALIGVEYLGTAVLEDRVFNGRDAEVGRQRIGEPPRKNAARCPVQDRKEVNEAALHWDVRNVRASK